jgi:hypothetical protein
LPTVHIHEWKTAPQLACHAWLVLPRAHLRHYQWLPEACR